MNWTDKEVNKLCARIKELERALKPFSEEADQWSDYVPDRYHPGMTEPKRQMFHARAVFNLGHLRRAKRLLEV